MANALMSLPFFRQRKFRQLLNNVNTQFRNMIRLQQPWAGKVPCYPGIGESLWEDRDITRLIDQIKITRELNTGGFTIFNYAMPQARRTVPLCGKGITRREQSPHPQH